jgi:hypothetical protein
MPKASRTKTPTSSRRHCRLWSPCKRGACMSSTFAHHTRPEHCRGYPMHASRGLAARRCPAMVSDVPIASDRGPSRQAKLWLVDGRADHIAPFGSGTLVIAHFGQAQKVLRHEPGVTGTLASAAVCRGLLIQGNTLRRVRACHDTSSELVKLGRCGPTSATLEKHARTQIAGLRI